MWGDRNSLWMFVCHKVLTENNVTSVYVVASSLERCWEFLQKKFIYLTIKRKMKENLLFVWICLVRETRRENNNKKLRWEKKQIRGKKFGSKIIDLLYFNFFGRTTQKMCDMPELIRKKFLSLSSMLLGRYISLNAVCHPFCRYVSTIIALWAIYIRDD